MALLSKSSKAAVSDPLMSNNPISLQVLGICSALAVTTKLDIAFVMTLAVIAVLCISNTVISLLRNMIPSKVRIIVQLSVIASMVILTDLILQAYMYDISKQLTVFVSLIITNCIIMGRLEAFAMANKPYDSILDGFGSGFGYAWIILVVAFFRELLGGGTMFVGTPLELDVYGALGGLFGTTLQTNGLFVDSIGAFVILGIIIWIQRTKNGYVEH